MSAASAIRIGTRGSLLAMAQSRMVALALEAAHPDLLAELVPIVTSGDRKSGALAEVGGKGLFTAELESALRAGSVDLAVHSAKDLPAEMDGDLRIAAVPPRGDPRDALVSRGGGPVAALRPGARVGTGSPRRAAQLLAIRPDLQFVPIRGNVDTRVTKVLGTLEGETPLDGVVLAMAGLERSGLLELRRDDVCPLEVETCIPAGGQGTLVVQATASNQKAAAVAVCLDDAASRAALHGERKILRSLGAQCRSCIAVHIRPVGGQWQGLAMAAASDGSYAVRMDVQADGAEAVAEVLLDRLRAAGAEELLRR